MKPLPPTLRQKKRYVLFRIVPHEAGLDGKQMYYAVYDAISSLYGDFGAAELSMAVVLCEGNYTIVRCRRGSEKMLVTAALTVNRINGTFCALRPVATSGTIAALRRRMPESRPPLPERQAVFSGMEYTVRQRSQEKVDLYGDGIKNQEILYFTQDDMEDI
ncbi:Ribonuclease P-related protein [Methanolacinia petrolearia DSM 11571]|uniref:Ribonuclease P protein component 2 n=1 Tax=Methanolacinia petrolearia (strain DSM 11571 / OCM 486 / SEBR 4847) TaxID=679926 RepID=E1RK01_METP4|nr:Rpp14/Pop5 family protein [Methanolacinia petrolearia]ADN35724.1 Ribonuclease P-related protein [Methanolacinia petrolearia DSM 11571]